MRTLTKCFAAGVVMTQVMVASTQDVPMSPSHQIIAAIPDPTLAAVLGDIVDRNPEIAVAAARAEAARQVAPQHGALPDPEAALTAFVLPPETRVGPQRATVSLSQRIPGGSKRKLRRQAALESAASSAAETEALRLRLITEARTLYHEIGYLDRSADVLHSDRGVLSHFEELARARYAAGQGLQQEVVTIQAEITRIDAKLSDTAARRAARLAALNALRDRPGAPISPLLREPSTFRGALNWTEFRERALAFRPEMASLAASARRADSEAELAGSRSSPNFMVGLTYGWIDRRTDVDVPDNGQDILGLTGGLTIPIWSGSIDAGREEATQRSLIVEEQRRATVTSIDRQLEELRGRLPELRRQLELFEGVLRIQSEQALGSAESAYASGRVAALSLLDAERTLLDIRLAAARSRADLAIALAVLEHVIAGPLTRNPAISGDTLAAQTPAQERNPGEKFEIRNSKFDIGDVQGPINGPAFSGGGVS